MAISNNKISQWVNTDVVDAAQMNDFTQDLYQRLSAMTDFSANRYPNDPRQGVILAVSGTITQSGRTVTVGNSSSGATYAAAVRFPTNNSPSVLQPGNGVFGFLPFGNAPQGNTITVPTGSAGYVIINYTITAASPNTYATNLVVPSLLFITTGNLSSYPNCVVVATILANGNIDQTKKPNYLITQAADANDITALANNVALTPALYPIPPTAQSVLFQQGRLCANSGQPYGDSTGSSTLYFTPTEQGNLISLYNGTSWVTQSFSETSLGVSNLSGAYDIYVNSTSATTVALSYDTFQTRRQLPGTKNNGKYISTNDTTKLFVGSINVAGGVVQSWYGTRTIWNLYNQVNNKLYATFGDANLRGTDPAVSTNFTGLSIGNIDPNDTNLTSNTTDGQGKFTFLKDPLLPNISVTSSINVYIGVSSFGIIGQFGLLCNQTSSSGAICQKDYRVYVSNGQSLDVLTLNYIFDISTTNAINGINYLLKADKTTSNTNPVFYNEGNSGLIGEYWG